MSSKNLFDRLTKEGKLKRQKAEIDYLNARAYLEKQNPQLKLFKEL